MKSSASRKERLHILALLIQHERESGKRFVSLEDPLFLPFRDQQSLRHVLNVLESQGYIEQNIMTVGQIHNIRLTAAGRSYFANQADQKHRLWLQLRFNLLQTILIALATFIAGLISEHYLLLIETLLRWISA